MSKKQEPRRQPSCDDSTSSNVPEPSEIINANVYPASENNNEITSEVKKETKEDVSEDIVNNEESYVSTFTDHNSLLTYFYDINLPSTSKGIIKESTRKTPIPGTDGNTYDPSEINLILSETSYNSILSELSQTNSLHLARSNESLSLCPLTSYTDVTSENNSVPKLRRKSYANPDEANNDDNDSTDSNQSSSRVFANTDFYIPDHNTPLIYDPELKKYVPIRSGDKFNLSVDIHQNNEPTTESITTGPLSFISQFVSSLKYCYDEVTQVPSRNMSSPLSDTVLVEQGQSKMPVLHPIRSDVCVKSRLSSIEDDDDLSLMSVENSVPGDHDSLCELLIPLSTPDLEGSPDREWIESPSPLLPKRRHSI